MDERIFKDLVKGIIAQCPKDNQEWLASRLKHGNEINFGKRIKSIIEPFKKVVGASSKRSKLIRNIVDTRNFLTHYDEALKTKAASGMELRSLCLKMEAFFQLHFLQILGFNQEEIKTLLKNYVQLQYKLK